MFNLGIDIFLGMVKLRHGVDIFEPQEMKLLNLSVDIFSSKLEETPADHLIANE